MNAFTMTLRDEHKADKRRRIFAAARERFVADGFEAATIRAIAADAGVGVGTVLLHAESKHALLQEVWREELHPVVRAAQADAAGRPLREAALALFAPVLRAYAARPALARVVVKELPWLEGEAQEAHRADLLAFVGVLVEAAIREGVHREAAAAGGGEGCTRPAAGRSAAVPERAWDPVLVAESLFTLYYGACLRLLAPGGEPDPERVLARLAEQVDLVLAGGG